MNCELLIGVFFRANKRIDTNFEEAGEDGRHVCWLFTSVAKELNKGRHTATPACDLEELEAGMISLVDFALPEILASIKKSGKNKRARARITRVLEVSRVHVCTGFRGYSMSAIL